MRLPWLAVGAIGALAFALALARPVIADHGETDFTAAGRILMPVPLSTFVGPVGGGALTQNLAPCDSGSDLQGLDGFWVELPEEAEGHEATLVPGEDLTDVDAYFYDESCVFIRDDEHSFEMSQSFFGEAENGTVPAGSRYVLVEMWGGFDGTFTFTVFAVIEEEP